MTPVISRCPNRSLRHRPTWSSRRLSLKRSHRLSIRHRRRQRPTRGQPTFRRLWSRTSRSQRRLVIRRHQNLPRIPNQPPRLQPPKGFDTATGSPKVLPPRLDVFASAKLSAAYSTSSAPDETAASQPANLVD